MLTSISFAASTALSVVLRFQGRHKVVVMLLERVHESALRSLHTSDDTLLDREVGLALALCDAGQHSKSEALSNDVLQKWSPMLALHDAKKLARQRILAVVKRNLGELDESENTLREGLLGSSRSLDGEHPLVLNDAFNLCDCLVRQGKYDECEIRIREGLPA